MNTFSHRGIKLLTRTAAKEPPQKAYSKSRVAASCDNSKPPHKFSSLYSSANVELPFIRKSYSLAAETTHVMLHFQKVNSQSARQCKNSVHFSPFLAMKLKNFNAGTRRRG